MSTMTYGGSREILVDGNEYDALKDRAAYLHGRVAELEEQVYRLRSSERAARLNSKTPAEQVTINHWILIDKLSQGIRYSIQMAHDFPKPVADFGNRGTFYDLAELRDWKAKRDETKAKHAEAMEKLRKEQTRVFNELWGELD